MWKKILISFSLAIQNIRSHFFHTILSVLGIVIGVAALVAILSLIDGMEKYAQEQITNTTSLKAILIRPETHKFVNEVRVKKENYIYLNYENFVKLKSSLSLPANGYLFSRQSDEILLKKGNKKIGAWIGAITAPVGDNAKMAYGNSFTETDLAKQNKVVFINYYLARQIVGNDSVKALIGQSILVKNKELKIIGIAVKNKTQYAEVSVPISLFAPDELKENPPMCVIESERVENVPALKTQVENWLQQNMKGHISDFSVDTNKQRVDQAAQGFLLFRVIMGMIVGISVIVGGIGVMNVLIISVTERTVEIGVRKAVGAKKRDIMLQFLAESVTISTFGSFLGLVFGILGTMVMIPIIKAITHIPFYAAYTWNTLIIISTISILVGIIFGTYPAMRASKLDPVEAIRRE